MHLPLGSTSSTFASSPLLSPLHRITSHLPRKARFSSTNKVQGILNPSIFRPFLLDVFQFVSEAMSLARIHESPPSTTHVHVRPSPPQERPSQRSRLEHPTHTTQSIGARDGTFVPKLTHSPRPPIPLPSLGRNLGEADQTGLSTYRKMDRSTAISRLESIHDHHKDQTDTRLTDAQSMDSQLSQLMAAFRDIRSDAFEDLGSELASYLPGHSDGTGSFEMNESLYLARGEEEPTRSLSQNEGQQSADLFEEAVISVISSLPLDLQPGRSDILKGDENAGLSTMPSQSETLEQQGFVMISPSAAGPSIICSKSAASQPESRPITHSSGFAYPAYSGSPIPPIGERQGSTSNSWFTPAEEEQIAAIHAGAPSTLSNAQSVYPSPIIATLTSGPLEYFETPVLGRSVSSLPHSTSMNLETPAGLGHRQNPTLIQSVASSVGQYNQRAKATGPGSDDSTAKCTANQTSGQRHATPEDWTGWVARSSSLAKLAEEMHYGCKLHDHSPERSLERLRFIFKAMYDVCYSGRRKETGCRVSHISDCSKVTDVKRSKRL